MTIFGAGCSLPPFNAETWGYKMAGTNKNMFNENGFTLIEALIALFVLTVGVLGMMTLQTTAISSNYQANTMTKAVSLATDRLEQLRSLSFTAATLKLVNSPYKDIDPVTGSPVIVPGYTVTWTVTTAPAPMAGNAKDIIVTVNRPQPFRPVIFSYRKFRDL